MSLNPSNIVAKRKVSLFSDDLNTADLQSQVNQIIPEKTQEDEDLSSLECSQCGVEMTHMNDEVTEIKSGFDVSSNFLTPSGNHYSNYQQTTPQSALPNVHGHQHQHHNHGKMCLFSGMRRTCTVRSDSSSIDMKKVMAKLTY